MNLPKNRSVLSRFRTTGLILLLAVGLVTAVFYSLVHARYVGTSMSRMLGPFSDALADRGFQDPGDIDLWRRIAERHAVTIVVEPAGGAAFAFDAEGGAVAPDEAPTTPLRADRTAKDGTRVTFYWTLLSDGDHHWPLLVALLVMIVAVVGTAFGYLQRQLQPLSRLQRGVDAVASGDFSARLPVDRSDEIGRVAASFNAMAGRVGEMIADRERLLADVSHELRSPISRMKVALELLPDGDKRDSLDRDLRSMERLVTVLLEREALRARAGRLDAQEVDLGALIQRVAEDDFVLNAYRSPGFNVDIRDQVTLRADPMLLELLVQNLVDNAVKFSHDESGPVEIMLARGLDPNGREHIVLRIADDGVGIPEGDLDALFKPFVKLDRARSHGMGYGVGLNLCQRIVHLHGGTIGISRRVPRGAVVVVALPIA